MTHLPLQMILDAALREQQKSRKARGDYWYASEIGGCPRRAFYGRSLTPITNPKSKFQLRQMRMGGLVEHMVLDNVLNHLDYPVGERKLKEAKREVEFNDDRLQVHGRADLQVVYDDGNGEIVECKCQNSRSFDYLNKEGKAKDYHEYQLWWYLYKSNTEHGQFIYVSRDDLRMMQFPLALSDKKVGDKVMARLNYLNQSWADKKIPPQLEKEGGLCSPKWCEYWDLCKIIKK